MNMKKNISWGMMLAAAFTLTNCAKEIDAPVQEPESVGYPFEIVASTVDTKTVNDGMSTKWAAGDKINVFHAVGETTEYVDNNYFTVSNLAEGRFTGNLAGELDPQEEYDWFAFYPYSSYIKTPGQQTNGYTYIGSRSDTPQAQTGVDNMNHIAGEKYPLYGKATAVGAGMQPKLTMCHASTLLKVNVTNMLETDLSVENIAFTAPEGTSLVGTFYLNITGEDVVYTDGQYVSNEANLSVSEATIAPAATAAFYLAVKPFTAVTGNELKIAVNGYEKTLSMTKDVDFTAGKIKTLKFAYDYVEEPSQGDETVVTISFANDSQRTSFSTTEQVWENDGVTFTNTKTSESSNVVNNVNPVRVYKNSIISISAPSSISKIEFVCNSSDYATSLKNSISGSTVSGTKVSVVLDGTASMVTYTLTDGQVRLNSMTVTYVGGDYVPPVLQSITVSGNYKTEFTQGETFTFGGVVTASYDNGPTKDVTNSATFDGYDPNVTGNQTIAVSYTENGITKGTSYGIVVEAAQGNAKKFVKVTSAPTDWSGTYLIVWSDNKARSKVSSKDLVSVSNSALSISNSEIVANSTTAKDEVIITAKSNGYTIQLSDGQYLYVTNSNQVNAGAADKASTMKLNWTSSGVEITGVDSANNTRYLYQNGTYYRMYKKNETYKLPTLYKLVD